MAVVSESLLLKPKTVVSVVGASVVTGDSVAGASVVDGVVVEASAIVTTDSDAADAPPSAAPATPMLAMTAITSVETEMLADRSSPATKLKSNCSPPSVCA